MVGWRRDKRVEDEVGKGPKAFSIAHTGFRLHFVTAGLD